MHSLLLMFKTRCRMMGWRIKLLLLREGWVTSTHLLFWILTIGIGVFMDKEVLGDWEALWDN
jgi:hypothetical protein